MFFLNLFFLVGFSPLGQIWREGRGLTTGRELGHPLERLENKKSRLQAVFLKESPGGSHPTGQTRSPATHLGLAQTSPPQTAAVWARKSLLHGLHCKGLEAPQPPPTGCQEHPVQNRVHTAGLTAPLRKAGPWLASCNSDFGRVPTLPRADGSGSLAQTVQTTWLLSDTCFPSGNLKRGHMSSRDCM